MPNNDIEVFEELTSNENTTTEVDYLTYAIFAYKKREWIAHFQERNGQQRPRRSFSHNAAEEHLKEYIEFQKAEAVNSSVLSEVKHFTSVWRHLSVALLMALLAPIILGGIIFFFGVFDSSFPIHITTAEASASRAK